MDDGPRQALFYAMEVPPDHVPSEVADRMARDLSYFHGRDGLAHIWSDPSLPPSQHASFQKVWSAIQKQ
jgi:hypothetical protein